MGCGFDSLLYSLPEPSGFPVKIQQKYKKGRQTKHFSLFHSFCLVHLFCWDQPTTKSARLKTLETRPAHPPVHLGVQWDCPVPPLALCSPSFQWKIGRCRMTALFLGATSKKYFLTKQCYTSNEL